MAPGSTSRKPVTIDGVEYVSKTAAINALSALGLSAKEIQQKLGWPTTINSVSGIISQQRAKAARLAAGPATAPNTWTPEKRDKARQLFGKTMIYIAEAINVPPREFLSYVLHGIIPPSQEIADPDDIRWRDGEAEPARELVALPPVEPPPAHAFEPVEGEGEGAIDADHMVTPEPTEPVKVEFDGCFTRDEDEAELAAMGTADEDQVERTETAEAPAAPASRFPDPPPAASACPAAGRLIPPGGLFPAGRVVRLKREDGKYLHENLQGFTDQVKHAWDGTRQQYDAVRQQMPKVLAKLSMEVVA